MLTSALEHYRRQQVITAAGLVEARRAAKRSPLEVAKVVTAYQIAAARDAVEALPQMLAQQGIPDAPVGPVAISGLVGRASDGRPLESLFAQSTSDGQLALMVATQLQDIARIAAGIGIAARPNVSGYARMLVPPSCSRCAILAGKFFKWNTGFQRHPRCDCRHVPSTEALSGDLTTDPSAYFNSLSADDQAKYFTKAGAQAIRDGANPVEVVNVRRYMDAAGDAFTMAPSRAPSSSATFAPPTLLAGIKFNQSTAAIGRMTPEGIYTIATDRADAIRLLRLHGYLL